MPRPHHLSSAAPSGKRRAATGGADRPTGQSAPTAMPSRWRAAEQMPCVPTYDCRERERGGGGG
eukprot:26513-Chlamydomonas_euryale.AAC.1